MKTAFPFLILVIGLITTVPSVAQELKHNDLATIKQTGNYSSYLSKDNTTYTVGDQLLVSESSQPGYYYFAVTKGEDYSQVKNDLTGTKLTITKIYILYKEAGKYYALFKTRDERNVSYAVSLEHGIARKEVSLYKSNAVSEGDNSASTGSTLASQHQASNNSAVTVNSTTGTIAPDARKIVFKSDKNNLEDFHDGYAVIEDGTEADGITPRAALINEKGEFVFPYGKFTAYRTIANGYIIVSNTPKESLGAMFKWGIINYKGSIIKSFGEVWEKAFVDENGIIHPPKNLEGGRVSLLRNVIAGKDWAFDSAPGYYLEQKENGAVEVGSEGIIRVYDKGYKYGFVKVGGNVVVKPNYLKAKMFSEGLAAAAKNNDVGELKWGFINSKNEAAIPFKFNNEPGNFYNGLAHIKSSTGEHAWIDKQGNIKFKMSDFPGWEIVDGYDGCDFINTVVLVSRDNPSQSGWLNTNGSITPFSSYSMFSRVVKIQQTKGQFKTFDKGGSNQGVVDGSGNVIVPPVFTSIGYFDEKSGLAKALYEKKDANGKVVSTIEGYINKQGVFVIVKSKEEKSEW